MSAWDAWRARAVENWDDFFWNLEALRYRRDLDDWLDILVERVKRSHAKKQHARACEALERKLEEEEKP
jgi:hypothetical protein